MTSPKFSAEHLRAVNAQAWADFKRQWPMELAFVLGQMGGGFLFGVAVGLAAFTAILQRVAL